MDLLNFQPAELERLLFVFIRVAAILFFAPFFGSAQVPALVKVSLGLVLALVLSPLIPAGAFIRPENIFDLTILIFTELTIGMALAYAVQVIFAAVQVTGTVLDFQMGFGVVNVIDPQTQSSVSITAQVLNIIAVLLFLALDGHHILLGALVESFNRINPAEVDFSSLTPEFILRVFTTMFLIALKIAAPVMAVLFFLSVGLGMVARTVPQMNVFIVGFPLQIGVGLLMIGLSMPFFSIIFKNHLAEIPYRLQSLLATF